VKRTDPPDPYCYAEPTRPNDYIGLPGLEQITAARMRQAMQGKKPVYASDEIQRAEAVRATLAHIQTLEDITVASSESIFLSRWSFLV